MERVGDRGEKWKNVSPAGVLAVWICCAGKFHISQQNVLGYCDAISVYLLAQVRSKKRKNWKLKKKNSWIFVPSDREVELFGCTKIYCDCLHSGFSPAMRQSPFPFKPLVEMN